MIPSTLAAEVTDALKDFLSTGFAPSSPALAGVIEDFLADSANLTKGPYLSLDLPFQPAAEGGEPFPEIPLGFTPHRHQRTAFERLASAKSTLVATGTGSGKTECFLFPILEHCRAQAGAPGIKAVVIYPMNALASDQARRIAEIVDRTPSLKGRVAAGLYVGEHGASPRTRMAPDHLIENRDALRARPPDILLTNYKMLDLLLTRPIDAPLWQHNEPGTLRYLVVDELHTFDGAQGTDLACLIRRLRVRLQADEHLVCVGTSATLGAEADGEAVVRYAGSVFHQDFERDAIVGEVRQSIDDFLGAALIAGHLAAASDLGRRTDPAQYRSLESYLKAQYEVFFQEQPPASFDDDRARVDLGNRLREHAAFVNLLRVVGDTEPTPLGTVLERLQRSLPVADHREALNVLNALCALICVAREQPSKTAAANSPPRPLLNVKFHLWLRELRRMVCSVCDEVPEAAANEAAPEFNPPHHRLRYSDDLKGDEDVLHLPLVQCRECHATGWGCVKQATKDHVERDLRVFYNRFFRRDVDVNVLFPLTKDEKPPTTARGIEAQLCGRCGYLAERDAPACPGCGQDRLVRVFRPALMVSKRREGRQRPEMSRDCPYCGAKEALIIFGARASSLLSTALAQLFASRHNDDRKVIAFSDNVQDAAHRGSFFAARTWRNSVRAAIAQVVAEYDGIPLAELPDRVASWWRDTEANAKAFDDKRFVTEFIAPDRLWLRDFETLREAGELPSNSGLLSLVQRRLRWDTVAELTFANAIGRTLERTRVVAVGVDSGAFARACALAGTRLREDFGEFREVDDATVRSLVLGIVRRMKDRGAVWVRAVGVDAALRSYLGSGGNPFAIRDLHLQDFGPRSALPTFPAQTSDGRGVDALGGGSNSWYRSWVHKVLAQHMLAATQNAPDVLVLVMEALREAGLAVRRQARNTEVWALDSLRLYVTTQTVAMRCSASARTLIVPAAEAPLWRGTHCLDLTVDDRYEESTVAPRTWAGRLYAEADIHRIISAEHTALVPREERDRLQAQFGSSAPEPWYPNLLSATPTLELGVDIGDLSTVVMCSVPPAPANYRQRTGRAGRRDGNALTVTVATGQPHDLFYYAEPEEMLGSRIEPPGVFLNAPAVLERQLTAFCLDCWVAGGVEEAAVPRTIRNVLDSVEKTAEAAFPYTFFRFVEGNGTGLLARFFRAFESPWARQDELDDESKVYLTDFLQGADAQASLRLRILKRLTEVAKDRQALRTEVETLRSRTRRLERSPSDESTKAEIKTLTAERRGLQRLLRNMNGRDTFGFLTDEGLLPNYAFPEPGVTLTSVIFQQREAADDDAEDDDTIVYDYIRPAAAALGEFAPENEFYAGGRRVAIRGIDTRVSEIEQWRFCPRCAYCECIDSGDRHAVCPRCGDAQWGDVGQRREMIRLRLVHAATPDRRSRIMDERDDREPLFYTRQLVADFDPESVSRAFAAENASQPFGFEYIPSATFREINFGRLDELDAPTEFAGETMPRKGFSICRRCGGVEGSNGEIRHTKTCASQTRTQTARDVLTPAKSDDVVDCLYLYREFKSEAVRILIPAAGALDADRRISSFIAALELGLRRQFAGAVAHLRVMTCQFPVGDTGTRYKFLMLYDTVPGGTGYLKQMMADPANVLAVLRLARDAIAECPCNADPEKDGCYRCVYAYRRSFEMANTSRDTALALLNGMLEIFADLKEVPGLRSVSANPLVESELEARFIEALGRMEVDGAPVRVRQDVVAGKPGFVATTGGKLYYLEAQAELGAGQGVAIPSRPDFLIRPGRGADGVAPVAVFMDGFAYHRDRTDEDSAKRMALVRAGFRVWSLTWRDLEAALADDEGTSPFASRADGPTSLQRNLDGRWATGELRLCFAESSLKLLVRYLQNPDALAWQRAVFTEVVGLFDPADMRGEQARRTFTEASAKLPPVLRETLQELPADTALSVVRAGVAQLLLALPLVAVRTADPDAIVAALHLDDARTDAAGYQDAWNTVLRQNNLLQFLAKASWTTTKGVMGDLYGELAAEPGSAPPEAQAPDGVDEAWQEALELALPEYRTVMRTLAASGVPVPEVGFEITGDDQGVVAQAELAWPDAKIAVGVSGDKPAAFEEAGWRVLSLDAEALIAALEEERE